MKRWVLAVPVLLAACGPAPSSPPPASPPPPPPSQPAPPPAQAPVEPIAPGQPGGLPDDRTPLPEGPIDPKSAQGAAQVVQTYYALIGEKKYADAWALWQGDSGMSADEFAASFDAFSQYDAQIGAPGEMEGAAGSSYVDVPVQIYGRTKAGVPFHKLGTVTLRRVNDVDGSTEAQRRWHIYRVNF